MGGAGPEFFVLVLAIVGAVTMYIRTKRGDGRHSVWLGGAAAGGVIGLLVAFSMIQRIPARDHGTVLFVYVVGAALAGAILAVVATSLLKK